jgi:hypothetical protein
MRGKRAKQIRKKVLEAAEKYPKKMKFFNFYSRMAKKLYTRGELWTDGKMS